MPDQDCRSFEIPNEPRHRVVFSHHFSRAPAVRPHPMRHVVFVRIYLPFGHVDKTRIQVLVVGAARTGRFGRNNMNGRCMANLGVKWSEIASAQSSYFVKPSLRNTLRSMLRELRCSEPLAFVLVGHVVSRRWLRWLPRRFWRVERRLRWPWPAWWYRWTWRLRRSLVPLIKIHWFPPVHN